MIPFEDRTFEQVIVKTQIQLHGYVVDIIDAKVGYDPEDKYYYIYGYDRYVTVDGYELDDDEIADCDFDEELECKIADLEVEYQDYLKDIYDGNQARFYLSRKNATSL